MLLLASYSNYIYDTYFKTGKFQSLSQPQMVILKSHIICGLDSAYLAANNVAVNSGSFLLKTVRCRKT